MRFISSSFHDLFFFVSYVSILINFKNNLAIYKLQGPLTSALKMSYTPQFRFLYYCYKHCLFVFRLCVCVFPVALQ